ncbi:MAG: protein kinase [Acidobacteriota bacterium]|nr:protein kinase [Acidobacteriota bacterium]
MTLQRGTRLGPYEVVSLLGHGGMGEVYRARDERLNRDVAIKVLPQHLAGDIERLARLRREAQVLASLNDPNIAHIHGLEETNGVPALILELVEGSTLAERLANSSLPLSEAIGVARQIADGLEAAHEKGVIHRDLKPANVKITPDGTVKLLDFGLAKAVSADGPEPDLSMVTTANTEAGVVLGTAAYMSPEQARGRPVDKRTDIWAFGCVLFEMLSGRRPFGGETLSDTIAGILTRDPDWEALPPDLPANIHVLLRRSLEKDSKRRLRDIGDARIELDDARGAPAGHVPQEQPTAVTRRTAIAAVAGAAAGAAATGLLAVSRYRNDATPRKLGRFAIPLPGASVITVGFNKRVAISPDGTYLACNPVPQGNAANIFIRSKGDLEMRPLVEGARGVPFFSHDSRWVGYFTTDAPWRLQKVALSGGGATTLCRTENFAGATWAADDMIYFVPAVPGGLVRVAAAGGDPVSVVKIDLDRGERLFKFPHALPGGTAMLLTVGTVDSESFDDAQIVVVSLRTGERRVLIQGGTSPCYSPTGHVVYARNGSLFAVPFDLNRLEVTGQPVMVLEGVLMSRNSGVANFEISLTGDLVYVPGRAVGGSRTLHWVDRSGRPEPLSLPPRAFLHPRLSPDATRLAIEVEGPDHDVHVYDFRSGVFSNLTADGVSHWPVWSPDGLRIGYRSGPMGRFRLFEVPADRSAPAKQVLTTDISQSPGSYSPDGRAIVFTMNLQTSAPPKIAVISLDGDQKPRPLDDSRYAQGSPKISPDGRYLAYCTNETGRPQVYVRAFPGPGPTTQVSTEGGTDPVWRRDGRELFYRNGDSMMVVPLAAGPDFVNGRPELLWKGSYSHGMSSSCGPPGLTSSNYDVTPDGLRFLMVRDEDVEKETAREFILVQGWGDELSRLSTRS